MAKRAIIYARVSTDEQAEKGFSLPTQLTACQQYAEQHGFSTAAALKDDCSGTIRLHERPSGALLTSMLDNREAEAVIVYTSDRLSRNLAHGLVLREAWQRAGIELHFVDTGRTADSAEGRLSQNVKDIIAEYEREKIRERTRRGKLAKAQQGRWVGTSHAPYGHRRAASGNDSRLEIDPETSGMVRRIYDLYLGRNGYRKHSVRRICQMLAAESVPPPQKGRGWYPTTVNSILTRTTCIGIMQFGGHDAQFPELAIIDRETFEAAQRQRRKNRETYSGKRKHDYLLASFLYCPCGGRMSGNNCNHMGYYVCTRRKAYPHMADCGPQSLRSESADAAVWEWVAAIMSDARQVETGLAEMAAVRAAEHETQRARLADAEISLAQIDAKIKRLASAIAEADNATAHEALRGELATQSARKEAVRKERDALAADAARGEITQAEREHIEGFAKMVRSWLADGLTFEQKRELLELLDLRAEFHSKDGARWLTATCAITPGRAVSITQTSSSRTAIRANNSPALSLTTSIPLPTPAARRLPLERTFQLIGA